MELKPQYIYLLQEREFIKTKEDIYKIGKTKQSNDKRFKQYPKDSILLYQIICDNCDFIEKNLIKEFKNKFTHCKTIGNEYFKGNYKYMIDTIHNYITYKCDPNKMAVDNFIDYYLNYFYGNGITFEYFYINIVYLYDEFKWWLLQNNDILVDYVIFIQILQNNQMVIIKSFNGIVYAIFIKKNIDKYNGIEYNFIEIDDNRPHLTSFYEIAGNEQIRDDIDSNIDLYIQSIDGHILCNDYISDNHAIIEYNWNQNIKFKNLRLLIDNYNALKLYYIHGGITKIIITDEKTKEGYILKPNKIYQKMCNINSKSDMDYHNLINWFKHHNFNHSELSFSRTIKNNKKIIKKHDYIQLDKIIQDQYVYNLNNIIDIEKTIEDITDCCYTPLPNVYEFEYSEYMGVIDTDDMYNHAIVDIKNITKFKNINKICEHSLVVNRSLHSGVPRKESWHINILDMDLQIFDRLLKFILTDQKIIEYKKLCKNIFINKNSDINIFYDNILYNANDDVFDQNSPLSYYITNMAHKLSIIYYDNFDYDNNRFRRITKNVRFAIINDWEYNKNSVEIMIRDYKNIGIKNIIVLTHQSTNFYKNSFEDFTTMLVNDLGFEEPEWEPWESTPPIPLPFSIIENLQTNFLNWVAN